MLRNNSSTLIVLIISAIAVVAAVSTFALEEQWTIPLKEGDKVPAVTFKTRTRIASSESNHDNPFDWKELATDDYFQGKRVVVFALPGAFTPTCSSSHLPGYEEKYNEILNLGIDDVYCLSVNDAFVMRQWGLHQGYVPALVIKCG
jgi:peroxiredoxin